MNKTLFFIIYLFISSLCTASESINLFDKDRERLIPIELYFDVESKIKPSLVIINHGYSIKNTEYSFLANALAKNGYFIASIQHDLDNDAPPIKTGNLVERRIPLWKRGVANILFTLQELKIKYPELDYDNMTLIGHSNGGDISMLFAEKYPELVQNIISLDSLRVKFSMNLDHKILSLRAYDTEADMGILPNNEEQKKFDIKIIKLEDAKHMDLCDRGPEKIKIKIINQVFGFLEP